MKIGAMDAIHRECNISWALFNWSIVTYRGSPVPKGSREMDMTTTYDGTLLDHLAEHMMYLSAASSFWFNLNSSDDHDCHLSKRLGMSPHDYEYLLVAANLAQFHPKWGFSIKILKWKLFLEGHQFLTINCMGTMEVSSKKLDLNAYVNGTKPTKNREK